MERNERKRQFLKWLISNYQHSNPSVNYLLQFLSTNSELMNNILFSEGAKYAPRGIYISFNSNTKLPFIYYKDQLSYTLSDQAFHDIRLNHRFSKQDFYVELDIPHLYQQLYRFDVFEDNPYIPGNLQFLVDLEDSLYQISLETKLSLLNKGLNTALEKYDFDKVSYYLTQIKKLKGE
ncbi:MAG TPA: hypothetical protein DEO37_02085 [Aerococcaceae bacterium]|nr:hypothetical protein [Aerococcaceae bacterium]